MKLRKSILFIGLALLFIAIIFHFVSKPFADELFDYYKKNESVTLTDRYGEVIKMFPNPKGYAAQYQDNIPERFKELLLEKEDSAFYYHPGINPFSIARTFYRNIFGGTLAVSTITQQLAKILLNNENDRTLSNKLKETWYTLALEWHFSKEEILNMYLNSVYFGNQVQGLALASELYFSTVPENLTDTQIIQLLVTLSRPTTAHPFQTENETQSAFFAQVLGRELKDFALIKKSRVAEFQRMFNTLTSFETPALLNTTTSTELTLDRYLSEQIRDIVSRETQLLTPQGGTNAAVVVIKVPENELLSIIGSPDPTRLDFGYQLNMAVKPRPIGSTIKPLIYLKGFEKGLRPYTMVEDREYKYQIGSGFSLYPKDYDYTYHGPVSLHYALSNSLNVPTVKVLEYFGISDFMNFLQKDVSFTPLQEPKTYQLGIALGQLEMDLLTLSYFFTLFPNDGVLKPLIVSTANQASPPPLQTSFSQYKKITNKPYIQLINKILTDRFTGIEQFGLKSDLNIFNNYPVAVKTGTSREFHDSWTIGYTPNFVVGVWVGNAANRAMDEVSGVGGAGKIWHEVVTLLLQRPYNERKPFDFSTLKEFQNGDTLEYGFASDDFEKQKNLLESPQLILSPHDGDTFLFEEKTVIPLEAREEVEWYVDGNFLEKGKRVLWKPETVGEFNVTAKKQDLKEEIHLSVVEEN